MAITNAEMAQAWGDLLGLTPEKVAELAGLLDQWALGGARLAVLSRLATDINLFNNAAVAMVHDWYGGTANGGPNGDGLYPLMNSDAEVFLMPSPARIMADLVSFNAKGHLPSVADLPATAQPGDLWVVNGEAWVWSASDGRFNNVGPFQGDSALKVLIDGGVLPAGSTAADFANWIANSQSAVIQPMVDAVEADRQAVDAAAGQVEADRQAVDAAAGQVEAHRLAVDVAVGQVEADRQAVDAGAVQVAADRQAVDAAAGAVEADRQAVDTAAGQVEAGRQAVAADRATVVTAAGEVEADRQAVDAGVVAVEADRQAVDAAAVQVEAMRGATQQFRNEAKQFRDEAAAIAGGDFLTEADGNALYRKLADLLSIADVDGLAEALASKATPADIQAAIAALVDGAPTALDTLKELAEALADNDDAVAALTLAIDAKAAKSDLAPDWHVKTGAYAAARLDRVLADTSGGAWSLTLPADGEVQVQDYAGTWAALNLTIIGPVRGVVGDLICDQSAILRFARPPGAAAWIVTKSEGVKA